MIPDVRQHSLTLAAVFVALAVGVAVGTAGAGGHLLAGQEKVIVQLEQRFAQLEEQIRRAAEEKEALRAQLERYRLAVKDLLPAVVARSLDGQSVEVIAVPGARAAGVQVESLLRAAGASVRLVVPRTGPAPVSAGAAHLLVVGPCSRVVGLVGAGDDPSSSPGDRARQAILWASSSASLPASPVTATAWVDAVDEPLGQAALLAALVEGREGQVTEEEAIRWLERVHAGESGERGGPCVQRGGPGGADGTRPVDGAGRS
ncbi:copper transporter [Carboxydochorda subterranea]|uniref:Copper transporter n=1 Tax=Carboxydichorda subterranea TaxID=3109565 RepID=A0ABZ1BZW2_9FIRM|nr:copper transporter [Limnochorda sp. L945t]WRP18342.1 copper transporter [Limnochorda sp. L945t]